MEGASHEAASLAGHLGLGKLVVLFDDNRITIEGSTELAYTEDVAGRFESYGWQVQNLGDAANDLGALESAFRSARDEAARPSLEYFAADPWSEFAEVGAFVVCACPPASSRRSFGAPARPPPP